MDSLLSYTQHLIGLLEGSYVYWNDLTRLSAPPSAIRPTSLGAYPAPTPVAVDCFRAYLASHPDQRLACYVLQGLCDGFRVGVLNTLPICSSARNHSSSRENVGVVFSYIHSECAAGRLLGPFGVSPRIHVSPIGLVPKGYQSGAWRMIVDLSHPVGGSVNDAIPTDLCSLHYPSVDGAVNFVLTLGRHTQLVKLNLKNAYQILPIHPEDRSFLGINWEGKVFIGLCLPFGLRSAPKIFTAFADAVTWALHISGVKFLMHYLDDFLLFGSPFSGEGKSVHCIALQVLADLGIPVALHKLEGPSTRVTFLGVVIDTDRLELTLPLKKLERLRVMVACWSRRQSGGRSDFDSFLGHLSQAAIVVRSGRIFLRHLFTLLARAPKSHCFVHLDQMARADLAWWDCFLVAWRGTSLFNPQVYGRALVHSDASGKFGCGAISSDNRWFQVRWPDFWTAVDISAREMVPIVLAAATWGGSWYRQHVAFYSDNLAVVAVIQRRSTKDPLFLHLLRCLYFYAAFYQFTYSAHHLPGVTNVAADALSRNNMCLLYSLVPQVIPSTINSSLLDLLVLRHPNWGSPAWTSLFKASLCILSPQVPLVPTGLP